MAQTQKGNWLAEGNIGNMNFSNSKNESTTGTSTHKSDGKGFNIWLYPRIGYFINDNVVIGTTLNLGYTTNTYST